MFKDVARAIWRAPLHLLGSIPVAALTIVPVVGPKVGKKYVAWRVKAEADDQATGRDTPEKAAVDLYTQTAFVKGILRIWGIKV